MEQRINEATAHMQRKHPLLVPLVVVALALFLIFLWLNPGFIGKDTQAPTPEYSFSEVNLVDSLGNARLPAIFPRDIPVNVATIVHAAESTYKYGAIRQGDVSYIIKAPLDTVLSSWKVYFEARDLSLTSEEVIEDDDRGFLYATDGVNDISILVLPESEGDIQRVNVSYTTRS